MKATIEISGDLHIELKSYCVRRRLSMRAAAEAAVRVWLMTQVGKIDYDSENPEHSNVAVQVAAASSPAAGSGEQERPGIGSAGVTLAATVAALRTPPTLLDADTAMRDQDLDDHL